MNSEKEIIENKKKRIFYLITYIIVTGLMFLFILSIICKVPIELTQMTDWVSFILGMVATIISIVSLWLSFHNTEQTENSNEKNLRDLNEIRDSIIDRIDLLPKKVADSIYLQRNLVTYKSSEKTTDKDWS